MNIKELINIDEYTKIEKLIKDGFNKIYWYKVVKHLTSHERAYVYHYFENKYQHIIGINFGHKNEPYYGETDNLHPEYNWNDLKLSERTIYYKTKHIIFRKKINSKRISKRQKIHLMKHDRSNRNINR